MRIFLDVGANTGQTLKAVIGKFDQIVCFEPAPICWPYLKEISQGKVKIEPFGLWDRNTTATLYDPGSKGSGLWVKDSRSPDYPITKEKCEFRKASEWFSQNLTKPATVYLKLNCEGAECDILDDLLDSGEFEKVTYAMVSFDSNKIKSLKHRPNEIRGRLQKYGYPRVAYDREVMIGTTHQDRINNWLRMVSEA